MVDINQWRACIGGWNYCHSSCRVSNNKVKTNPTITDNVTILAGPATLPLVLVLVLLLVLSGDIELNPGPGLQPDPFDIFRFLQPHSLRWDEIGRALNVDLNTRRAISQQAQGTSAEQKLEEVIDHWIESQCSEVSWDNLMEMLQELGLVKIAKEIETSLLNDEKMKTKYKWIKADGECIYTVSGPSPREIDYQDKGVISLVIPAGAIPLNVSCDISIKPIQPSQCTFPDNTVLVSELFEVTTSCDINEPITIKLRHCVELPDDNNHEGCLTFLKTQHDKPFHFEKKEGGTFTSEYGDLNCRSFSNFGIGWIRNIDIWPFPLRCCALLLHVYNERNNERTSTLMGHVIVTKDNGDLIMKAARSLYKDGSNIQLVHPQTFYLRQSKLTVRCTNISEDGNWNITPNNTPAEISRRAIEDYNDPQSGTTAPWLDYIITVNDDCSLPLTIPFTFEVAPDPFIMNLSVELPTLENPSLNEEEHRLKQLAKEALINGRSVKLRALKGILIGGPGVGKTITFKRLTNRRGNIEKDGQSRSTGVEKPDTVHLYRNIENDSVLVPADGKHWSPQSLEGQLSTFLYCLEGSRHNELSPSPETEVDDEHIPIPDDDTTPINKESAKVDATSIQSELKQSPQIMPSTMTPNPQPIEQPSPALEQMQQSEQHQSDGAVDSQKIENLIKPGKLDDIEREILKIGELTVLYMIDLGGQPEYFEILPLLLHGPLLGIIFINLSLSLTQRFNVTYRHTESTHSTISYTASYCQVDMVQQVLALIHALSPENNPQSDTAASHAFLIGTYKDKCSSDTGIINDFEKKVKESLKDTQLYYLLKMFHKNDFIFPIDNYYGDETEIEGLRKALSDQIYDKFEPEEINVRWAIFHLLLRSKYEKPGFCNLSEAIDLGCACGLTDKDSVENVLKYLHFRFGTILYYHKVASLSDRVICDPNLIFRPLTVIVAESFGSARHDQQIAEKIRETGIIPLNTIEKACKKTSADNQLSTDDIVDLLKHHNILSKITHSNGKSVFFMPCLLNPYDDDASDDDHQHNYLDSLLFTFDPYGFQPIGLFYALSAKLLSSGDFKLQVRKQFRNKIEFIFKDVACVKISSMLHYLEVCIVSGNCSPETCVDLRTILHETIDLIMMELLHTRNVEANVSFYCPVSIEKNDLHIAELLPTGKLDCYSCGLPGLTQKQKTWFENAAYNQRDTTDKDEHTARSVKRFKSSASANDPIDALKASQLMKSWASRWQTIGQALGLSQNDRDMIQERRGNDANILLEAVLNKWAERQGRAATWRALITKLEEAGLINPAQEIQAEFQQLEH